MGFTSSGGASGGRRLPFLVAGVGMGVAQASQPRALMLVHLHPDTGTAEGPLEQ